ncbi:hypothetical protein [Treponema sp.]|uniref:hypothetical protein n=1 Tax=Treponema sp. TaxID=166 RepID=UPI003EFC2B56
MAKDVTPEEFFIPPADGNTGLFYLDRGDIVTFAGKHMLVLTEYEKNKKLSYFIGVENAEPVDITTLAACPYVRKAPVLVGKASAEKLNAAVELVETTICKPCFSSVKNE